VTGAKVLMEGAERATPPQLEVGARVWRSLGWAGWMFVVVGGADSLLAWVPSSFGQPEWEFGTIAASLNGLPLPVLGLVLVLCAELMAGRRRTARVVAALMVALAVVILAAGILYATNAPLALRTVTQPVAHAGLVKAMLKTTVQVVAYPAGLAALAAITWKLTRIPR